MISYDLEKRLTFLRSNLGLKRDFDYSFEKAEANKALWSVSDVFVTHAIQCILAGWYEEAARLLIKAKTWMDSAIKKNEVSPRFENESNRFHQKLFSIICWLNDGKHDDQCLTNWRGETMDVFRNDPGLAKSPSLGLTAVTFIDAGAFKEYLALAAPAGTDSIKCSGVNEKQMCLTLAVQALTQKFPEDKVRATVKKFLDTHVGKWLSSGHAIRAAEWMKIIYWKQGEAGISPFDAVRKCLEHVELNPQPTNS